MTAALKSAWQFGLTARLVALFFGQCASAALLLVADCVWCIASPAASFGIHSNSIRLSISGHDVVLEPEKLEQELKTARDQARYQFGWMINCLHEGGRGKTSVEEFSRLCDKREYRFDTTHAAELGLIDQALDIAAIFSAMDGT